MCCPLNLTSYCQRQNNIMNIYFVYICILKECAIRAHTCHNRTNSNYWRKEKGFKYVIESKIFIFSFLNSGAKVSLNSCKRHMRWLFFSWNMSWFVYEKNLSDKQTNIMPPKRVVRSKKHHIWFTCWETSCFQVFLHN
jgi:hypothetical protein